ncbi:hypothetical protein E4U36_005111 [Claviceps purpurea]|nr:hypothetical protein E4U36_005111 [Claviceps purpurea]
MALEPPRKDPKDRKIEPQKRTALGRRTVPSQWTSTPGRVNSPGAATKLNQPLSGAIRGIAASTSKRSHRRRPRHGYECLNTFEQTRVLSCMVGTRRVCDEASAAERARGGGSVPGRSPKAKAWEFPSYLFQNEATLLASQVADPCLSVLPTS